ncbi:adenosylhomocysteinase [Curtobacterium sp. MCBD17_034]|uniref:adenosylhomocysteinase n=1 Tax=unclassified Curtobacterium TaxID=257496 RepID=UPI000DA85B4E|nr:MULTISPECIES: adenosylhomocysteinase [unclassified Curtobacterium]PZF60451.1 adenosylhomocysteinase [Curtobacterium sp. MCBD17_034]PZM35141.1 adenosylhomocysteinase [Curtobacterium sp. MCBD17_031]
MPPAHDTDPDVLAWAGAAVRRYAAATNLLVAGRRFRVVGPGPDASTLRAVLTAMGARHAPEGPVDQLWCTGDPAESTAAVDAHGAPPRGRTLVVIDAGRHVPAVDEDAFGPVVVARPGVLAVPHHADGVFLVSTGREPERDALAAERIRWAGRYMPVSRALAAQLRADRALAGVRVGVAMVLEPKTAVLSLLLQDAGADVVVYAHADETDDAVAAALRDAGLVVFASSTVDLAGQRRLALEMLDREPQILLDDGAHVIRLLHEVRPELLPGMVGAAEETTGGLRPLRSMAEQGALRLPVVAVNDARAKTLFDNRYGTGQSTVFAVFDLLDAVPARDAVARLPAAGGTAAVIGYGPVGEGVAQVLTALGLRVVVAETDPVRALQAVFAGYDVAPVRTAVAGADLVMSATGVRDTVSLDVLRACAPDAVVAVAGGIDQEVATDDAHAAGSVRTTIAPRLERMTVPGTERAVVLVDGGGCVNITAAEGNPIEIMDLSFAVQLAAVRMLLEHGAELPVGVHPIDPAADARIAAAALAELGLAVDSPRGPDPDGGAQGRASDVRTTRFGAPP